ncbi:MAG: glycosyltransferase family 2 protein [Marmoricola sp.]
MAPRADIELDVVMARADDPPLVCTVSTVKDTRRNVEAFVGRNLAAGVDHMFVFLDAPDPETQGWLDQHPHTTAIPTGDAYGAGTPPDDLNLRQSTNANLANCLLAPFDRVRWLFHIDGDECLDVDRTLLLGLDDSARSVRLHCLEAVSQRHREGEVRHFKRVLPDDDLHLLATLGVIEQPTNRSYFNAHITGKSGFRPSIDIRVRVHNAEGPDGVAIEGFQAPGLRLLHYESFSGEEFVRKWAAHLSGPNRAKFRAPRDQLRGAVKAILDNDVLSEARKRDLLMQVYQRLVEDDFATLQELGYLVSPTPENHRHLPQSFTREERSLMSAYLERLLDADKGYFNPRAEGIPPRPLIEDICTRAHSSDPALSRLLAECVAARHPAGGNGRPLHSGA